MTFVFLLINLNKDRSSVKIMKECRQMVFRGVYVVLADLTVDATPSFCQLSFVDDWLLEKEISKAINKNFV